MTSVLRPSRLLQSALLAGVLTLLFIFVIDQPFARWLATRETWPALWDEGIQLLEYPLGIEPYPFAGVWMLVVGSILTLAIPRLKSAAFVFALVTLVHLTGRIGMLWLKFGFGRLRPTAWLKAGAPDDTFWHHNAWSFPSGHTILFASVVVPIAVVYPRTRPLLVIAVFAMTARVMVNAHFVSDVLAGYALIALLTWAYVRLLQRALQSSKLPASLR